MRGTMVIKILLNKSEVDQGQQRERENQGNQLFSRKKSNKMAIIMQVAICTTFVETNFLSLS